MSKKKPPKKIVLCYWCNLDVEEWGLHHVVYGRHCCYGCFNDRESHYRRVYGPDATVEDEAKEVRRAREYALECRDALQT